MTTETLNNVVEVVKTRALARDNNRKFFLQNARRMWGLPEDEADGAVRIQVEHTSTEQVQPPAPVVPPVTPEHPIAPVEPVQPVQPPCERPSAPTICWKDWLPWAALILALLALLTVMYLLATGAGSGEKPPIVSPPVEGAAVEDSLLQYLEDQGDHLP